MLKTPRLPGYRLLVIDDSPDIGLLFRRVLQREGAVVEAAGDALSGLNLALAAPYDLILMDLEMPGMGGLEAMAVLTQRGYQGKVVALTAHVTAEKRAAVATAGFTGFMAKDGDWPQIIVRIAALAT